MLQEMVAGYFDPDAKRLYLIAGVNGEAQRPVILHELIHALEDQYYDLKKRVASASAPERARPMLGSAPGVDRAIGSPLLRRPRAARRPGKRHSQAIETGHALRREHCLPEIVTG